MMRGDLSFGEDEESRVGREVELGTAEPENRQSEDRDNVIEMVQEDGLPVEEKPRKEPVEEAAEPDEEGETEVEDETEAEDEDESETEAEEPATKPGKSEKPEKPAKGGKALKIAAGVVAAALLIVGGMFVGAFWQRKESADKLAESGAEVTDETLLGGGGGVPMKNVKLIPEDDKLALAFLKLHNTRENSCYSPLSMRYALEMLREGADGETKAQIDELLGGAVATRYENVAEHLSLANSLWVRPGWEDKIQEDYKKTLKENFGAEVKTDNFQSAENMNRWIEDNTLGLMKKRF